jgi:general secretion pathway protein G
MVSTMRGTSRTAGGFTLLELLVVLTILALLLTLALPRYFRSIDVAREQVLIENLRTTRDAIDKFYGDNGRYPASLEELTEKKYLRFKPFDPLLESAERWVIVPPPQDIQGNVYDLKSAAQGTTRDGKPYSGL